MRKLFVMFFGLSFALSACAAIPKDTAGNNMARYLEQNMLKPGIDAQVQSVEREGDIYAVTVDFVKEDEIIGNRTMYMSTNGKYMSVARLYDLHSPYPEDDGPGDNDPGQAAEPTAGDRYQSSGGMGKDLPKRETVNVKMFVMSGCPYGVQAEEKFKPVAQTLGSDLDFDPHFIVSSRGRSGDCIGSNGQFCSMHGKKEALEDIRQVCILDEQGQDKWWQYVSKFNEDCYKTRDFSKRCSRQAAKAVGVNFNEVEQCVANRTDELLSEEAKLVQEYKATASPSIFINGVKYRGKRSPNALLSAVCDAYKDPPEACGRRLTNAGGNEAAAKGGCGAKL